MHPFGYRHNEIGDYSQFGQDLSSKNRYLTGIYAKGTENSATPAFIALVEVSIPQV